MRVVATVLAVLVYALVCFIALIYITLPLAFFTMFSGLAAGMVVSIGGQLAVLTGWKQGTQASPTSLVFQLPGASYRHLNTQDMVWPNYFAVQIWLDFWEGMSLAISVTMNMWKSSQKVVAEHSEATWPLLIGWPVTICVPLGMAMISIGVVFGLIAVAMTYLIVVGIVLGIGTAISIVFRSYETALRRLRHAESSCDYCNYVSPFPAFRCTGPHGGDDDSAIQLDVRPGSRGFLWRRCICGEFLPTGVTRSSKRLPAACPLCLAEIGPGSGVVTDSRIGIFGAAGSGKTTLIFATLDEILRGTAQEGTKSEAIHQHSRKRVDELALFCDGRMQPDPTTDVVPTTIRFGDAGYGSLVHWYDASGHRLIDPSFNNQHAYLEDARSLIYVVDPLRLTSVRAELGLGNSQPPPAGEFSAYDPEESYQATVMRLRLYGVETRRKQLAVAVTKADLLAGLPTDRLPPRSSAAIAAWLVHHRLDNVVLAAERDFGSVRYFLVSSVAGHPIGASGPSRWLLARDRVHFGDVRAT